MAGINDLPMNQEELISHLQALPLKTVLEMHLVLLLENRVEDKVITILLSFLTEEEELYEMTEWLRKMEDKKLDFQTIWFKAEKIKDKYTTE